MCRQRVLVTLRWLLPLLVLFLVAGHACELSAAVEAVGSSHGAGDHRHGAEGHAGDPRISCEAAEVVTSSGPQAAPGPDGTLAGPVVPSDPLRLVTPSLQGEHRPPARRPLYLLHASLLI